MKLNIASSSIAIASIIGTSSAFTTPSPRNNAFAMRGTQTSFASGSTSTTFLQSSIQGGAPEPSSSVESEVERLRLMAQKLRAEASILETEQQKQFIEATKKVFSKFDTNNDGDITAQELSTGLQKMLKLEKELPQGQIDKLIKSFDTSGDGKLQLDEFVSLDRMKSALDNIMREERQAARQAQKMEQQALDEAKLEEARALILNDGEPTTSDKVLSTLPYLFPLLDSIQFGAFLLTKNQDNPVAIALVAMYALFRAIPLSGFIGFLSLSFFRENPTLNKLVRFNMGQAIYLDVALFFPGLLATVVTLLGRAANGGGELAAASSLVPPQIAELGADAVFLTMAATIAYCVGSSLLGITPDKIPIMSQAVQDRMLTKDMFDENGRFVLPPDMRGDNDKNQGNNDKN